MIKGIDISHYQGENISWSSVASEQIQFVYIKASEGISRKEPFAQVQATGAKEAGLKVGYYHFARVESGTGINEAIFFDSILKSLPPSDLLPCLDIEVNKSGLSPEQITKWIEDFTTQIKGLGYSNLLLYSYTPFLNAYLLPSNILAQTKLWIAEYTNATSPNLPRGYSQYSIWQQSQTGTVKRY